MTLYPRGPWRAIALHVGTRSIKQVQTHAQKYQQKLLRHRRGLMKQKAKLARGGHRVDAFTVKQFTRGCILRRPKRVLASSPQSPSDPTQPDPQELEDPTFMEADVEPLPFTPNSPVDTSCWDQAEICQLVEILG